ncbi:NAD(P)H-hydrate dehydratase [Candidatus Peribacteria bacterium RIFCSPHIGHO2_02_FULL_53_20]|nr:MAG: NAD(P)H-hydrate dehydratase [Candidatus Peribacteria bacterium RIFCSPHIGHO2_02_FULL_53_20]OGJ69966.1 MAG: NAD(P)H-hydrate dehydratase [Candidatus Peribacteria bacterium RIFCSPLOWO2_12_FULL_53_10]
MVTRHPHSHKGENGKIAVIGGSSTIHGAPIFSALAAQSSGADLIFLMLPACHTAVARSQSLNFQVHPFCGDELSKQDREPILELLATMDAAVIGPGIARDEATLNILREIISEATCPLVLDATSLQPWTLEATAGKTSVLTPHLGELERMAVALNTIGPTAKKYGVTILTKGQVDRIAGPDGSVHEVSGGNAGLTVGGTGDALAGLVAGLIAQGHSPLEASVTASTVIKRAGSVLYPEFGYSYGTRRVIEQIPHVLRTNNQ